MRGWVATCTLLVLAGGSLVTGAGATVTARVLFRRLYEPIAGRYGWDLGEVVMAGRRIEVR